MNTKVAVTKRDSSLELLRIVTMLIIVAHHYVVNSGLIWEITLDNALSTESLFTVLYGWGGKTGINCFVLLTGYFMCKSNISLKKFLKVLLEFVFYRFIFYIIFVATGYTQFSMEALWANILPIYGIGTSFVSSFLFLYLCIPYLNILIKNIDEKMHARLLALCLGVFTILPSFFEVEVPFNYVTWFIVLYLCAAYIRMYPKNIFDNRLFWGVLAAASLLLSWYSVVAGAHAFVKLKDGLWFYWVHDSNKILAFTTAFCAFMFFKNLHLKYNPVINKIAASAFGVLLIHGNSDLMRQWLWVDTLKNTEMFYSEHYILHAVVSVIVIYIVCTIIDMARIQFIEKPFFKWFDKVQAK